METSLTKSLIIMLYNFMETSSTKKKHESNALEKHLVRTE